MFLPYNPPAVNVSYFRGCRQSLVIGTEGLVIVKIVPPQVYLVTASDSPGSGTEGQAGVQTVVLHPGLRGGGNHELVAASHSTRGVKPAQLNYLLSHHI
mgnify:CR=1 FL=1